MTVRVSINDANPLGGAELSDIIPIARTGDLTPTTITVGDVIDKAGETLAPITNPFFSGKIKNNATVDGDLFSGTTNTCEINDIHEDTVRAGATFYTSSLSNTQVSPTSDSDKVVYGSASMVFNRATDGANVTGTIGGQYANVSILGSGNITSVKGAYTHINLNGSGAINQCFGNQVLIGVTTGTVTTARVIDVRLSQVGGTITNGYGVYIGVVSATNAYSIFASDPGSPSYFAAKVSMAGNANITLSEYADNAAALLAGLSIGDMYRTGDALKIVH